MTLNSNKIILTNNDTAYFAGYKDARISDLISLNSTDNKNKDNSEKNGSEEIIESGEIIESEEIIEKNNDQ